MGGVGLKRWGGILLGLLGGAVFLTSCVSTAPAATAPVTLVPLPTASPPPVPAVEVPSFQKDLLPMFRVCGCHGFEEGRFVPTTYDGVRSVVVPGDPAASSIVQMMTEGHHTGVVLSKQQLAVVIRWIEAGAPDN
jgi:hypothetical protein